MTKKLLHKTGGESVEPKQTDNVKVKIDMNEKEDIETKADGTKAQPSDPSEYHYNKMGFLLFEKPPLSS